MSPLPLVCMHGMDDVLDAMACLMCTPGARTLLICGPPGTGKSVAARGFSRLFPDVPVVEVPANTAVEALYGSIDVEEAIASGRRTRSDAMFPRADGGVLIADNANLLEEGVLLAILDTVREGVARAEIGGMTSDYGCDLRLICTADIDERPIGEHLLDRFDICVRLSSAESEEDRKSIILANLRGERHPSSVASDASGRERELRGRVERASRLSVGVPADYPDFISRICREMNVEGHRGDVAVLNTALALSALDGRETAGMEELRKAVRLCLEHRARSPPEPDADPPETESDEEGDEGSEEDSRRDREDDGSETTHDGATGERGDADRPQSGEPDEPDDGDPESDAAERVFSIGEKFDVRDFVPPQTRANRNRRAGRREKSKSDDGSGRTIGDREPRGEPRDISLTASIKAAAPYQSTRDRRGLAVALEKRDLREKVRIKAKGTKILFVVDGSGSVGAHERMVAVKGAILSMLDDAYRRRDEVGLVVFRGDEAKEILPMTRSVLTAYRHLRELPTGGRTPLLSGLRMGYEILRADAVAGMEPVMVILTDGRGNVGTGGGKQTAEELVSVAGVLADSGIRILVVDTEAGYVRFGKAAELGRALSASCVLLEDLNAKALSESVRSAMGALGV